MKKFTQSTIDLLETKDKPVVGLRKPDFTAVAKGITDASECSAVWFIEIKSDLTTQKNDKIGQTVSCAHTALDKQPWRQFVYSILADDKQMYWFKSIRQGSNVRHEQAGPYSLDSSQCHHTLAYLMTASLSDLGFTAPNIPQLRGNGLFYCGEGRTSFVWGNSSEKVAKVAKSNDQKSHSLFRHELLVLTALRGVAHIAQSVDNQLHKLQNNHPYILLTPLCKHQSDITHRFVYAHFCQLVRAAQGIHERGWIHRDIRPSNVLFKKENNNEICLVDFGYCIQHDTADLWQGALHFASDGALSCIVRAAPYNATYRDDLHSIVRTSYILTRSSHITKTLHLLKSADEILVFWQREYREFSSCLSVLNELIERIPEKQVYDQLISEGKVLF